MLRTHIPIPARALTNLQTCLQTGNTFMTAPIALTMRAGPANLTVSWVSRNGNGSVVAFTPVSFRLFVRDIYGNLAVNRIDRLAFNAYAADGSAVNMPVRTVSDYNNGTYLIGSAAPQRMGTYNWTVTYNTTQVLPTNSSQVLVVTQHPSVNINMSSVTGHGAGSKYSPLYPRSIQQGAFIKAGVVYRVVVQSFDMYGNQHDANDQYRPGFNVSSEFARVCTSLSVADPGDGTTVILYSINTLGLYDVVLQHYNVSTSTTTEFYRGLIQVTPGPPCAECSNTTFPLNVTAGHASEAVAVLRDYVGNDITDAAPETVLFMATPLDVNGSPVGDALLFDAGTTLTNASAGLYG